VATENKRLSNLTLGLIGGASFAASLWVCRGILMPIVMAGFLAVILHPARQSLRRRFGRRPHLFAFAATLGVLVLIIAPIGLTGYLLLTQILHGVDLLRVQLGDGGFAGLFQGHLPPAAMDVIQRVETVIPINTSQISDAALEASKLIAPTVGSILAFSGKSIFDGFILLLSLYYFFLDGERLGRWLTEVVPLNPRYGAELFQEFRAVLQAIVWGSVFGIVLSAVVASLIYWPFGLPSPFVWGTLTGLVSIVPAVGGAILWVPLGLLLMLMGHVGAGVGMLAVCAVAFVIIDNLVKPLVVGRGMTLHPLLILVGIIGGATTLGLSGLIIGPLVLSLFLAIMRIYRRDFLSATPVPASAPPPTAR
jgi:predicted PurR-regulated permease PerM